jgi:hypothetical protein
MKRWRFLTALVVVFLTGACGGGDGQEAATKAPSPTEQATGTLTQSPAAQQGASVIWSQFGKAFDEPTAWFAVHVQNAGEDPSVFTVNVQALDATGTIVGSNEYTTPTIAGHGSFDLFDQLGGNAFVTLTGTPTKVVISRVEPAMNAELPLLPTSELKLARARDQDDIAESPYSYDMTVKVTNDLAGTLTSDANGVHQQVILYRGSSEIVGGGAGASDNQPNDLPPGASYRESWTGIPAWQAATRAVYSVWTG